MNAKYSTSGLILKAAKASNLTLPAAPAAFEVNCAASK